MPAPPAYCRLTVLAPGTRADVALPADVPAAELVPMLMELFGRHGDPGAAAMPWRLTGATGGALPPDATLDELGVVDGELLRLGPDGPAPAARGVRRPGRRAGGAHRIRRGARPAAPGRGRPGRRRPGRCTGAGRSRRRARRAYAWRRGRPRRAGGDRGDRAGPHSTAGTRPLREPAHRGRRCCRPCGGAAGRRGRLGRRTRTARPRAGCCSPRWRPGRPPRSHRSPCARPGPR